ncbi:hypothetical protein ACIBAH_15875 [Streptomyces sp. NPDC051445]|uniref:hypothetical protein n=1 Tax=Streptomyces sp. NPDC051445 TaxID=3365653 RepID=UPI0037892042
MEPWKIELSRVDWSAYECACGERGHLGGDLQRIIEARSLGEWGGASLDGHVEDQSMVADVAVPAVGVMMAALQEDLAVPTRSEFMINLWRLVDGEADESVTEEIHEQIRDGIWLIYREATNGDTETAMEILECVERDPARLEHFRTAVARRLSKRTR